MRRPAQCSPSSSFRFSIPPIPGKASKALEACMLEDWNEDDCEEEKDDFCVDANDEVCEDWKDDVCCEDVIDLDIWDDCIWEAPLDWNEDD